MSVFSRLFDSGKPIPAAVPAPEPNQTVPDPADAPRVPRLPTLKAAPARLTDTVTADLAENIRALPDFTPEQFDTAFKTACLAVQRGGDAHVLSQAIGSLGFEGVTKRQPGAIATELIMRALALINQERQVALAPTFGFTEAMWHYSGAACISDHKNMSEHQRAQDKAHSAADGKRYGIKTGMYLNGKWTHPGREAGCRCFSETIIEGLE